MSGVEYLVSTLAAIKKRLELIPSFTWGSIVSVDPLQVRLDGQDAALDASAAFGGTLVGGARVLCVLAANRIYVFAKATKGEKPIELVPTGVIMEFAGVEPPKGWLICDGRQLRISDYPALYSVIGNRYGGAGGMFALPDHRGRVGVGYNHTNSDFNQLGKLGGSSTHTLTVNEMPRHDHYINGGWGAGGMGTGSFRVDANNPRTRWTNTGHTGGNQPHNNLQPYITINFIIKY